VTADRNDPMQRGQHNIEDELIFTDHDGYIFHDSPGFESGSEEEVKIVQDFVRRRSQEKRLNDRLHAIWFVPSAKCRFESTKLFFRYCIPMDNDRPLLDQRHFGDIAPDGNGMSKYNSCELRWTEHSGIFSSPCDSSIHQVRSVQAQHQDEDGGSTS
jgi:hypothetical protein